MNFKIDENLPVEMARMLISAGHDASTVAEEKLAGARDEDLAAFCRSEQRILITLDVDFGDIRSYPPNEYPGFVVLRLKRQDKNFVMGVFNRMIVLLGRETLQGKLWIVEEERVRIR